MNKKWNSSNASQKQAWNSSVPSDLPGQFMADEDGMGTVEIILIIVVLIALVIIFKNQLTALVNKIFGKINSSSDEVIGLLQQRSEPMV